LLLPLFISSEIKAEETALIKIRTISAHNIEANGEWPAGALKSISHLPPVLNDVAFKLQDLPYNAFKLQGQSEVQVGLHSIREVRLASDDPSFPEHTLKLKLLGLNRGKVCLWMNWREADGGQILESRVHFKQGEQFVTGTEAKDGGGMLVVLQVTEQR